MAKTTPMNQLHCANCGEPVSRRGPTPTSGRRYCMKQACQDAKARAAHEDRLQPHRKEWAPTECSNCGTALPARKKRRTDSPAGRWCQKAACQEERKRVEKEFDIVDAKRRLEVFESDGEFLREILMATGFNLDPCPECGGRGLPGWVHPNNASPRLPCSELGGRPIARATAILISPAFREMVESS